MIDPKQVRQLVEAQFRIPSPLHDYQWEGISFLHRSQSALLADEMGLGKTVQTIIALALLIEKGEIERALIVAPSALVTNWMEELSVWAPSLTVRLVQGAAPEREIFYMLPVPVLVSSYEQIRADGLDRMPTDAFDLVILDEAQRIKNSSSTTSLACRILPRKRAWALSATPLENDVNDMISILHFLDPSVKQGISGSALFKRLSSIMLRRRKSDVRSELPPVIAQDLKLDLSVPQRIKYDDLWVERLESIRGNVKKEDISTVLLGLITRLKIICNYDIETNISSKFDALTEILHGAGQSARILVFSQFVETLEWIAQRLNFSHDLLIGSMSMNARQDAIARFKKKEAPRALLISLKAGGVGLNLGEASHVVLFDRWWNPATEVQAIYRAHRFERNEPLHVFRFLTIGTIEERISDILRVKEELFAEIVEPKSAETSRTTKEDLMQILDIVATDIPRT